jgi:hypothetical protein
MANQYQAWAQRAFLRRFPLGSPAQVVRGRLEQIGAQCRTVVAGQNGLDVCLAEPIDFAQPVFTQMAYRLMWQRGRLAMVEACPTLVHLGSAPSVDTLPRRVQVRDERDLMCWRTPNELATASLMSTRIPDRRTAVQHLPAIASDTALVRYARDRSSRDPVRDTIWVVW